MVRNYIAWGMLLFSTITAQSFEFEAATNDQNSIPFDVSCTGGITLQDHGTACRVASDYPLGGPIDLYGGTLELANNITAKSSLELVTSGTINGAGYTLELPHRIRPWRVPEKAVFGGSSVESPLTAQHDGAPRVARDIGGMDWASVPGVAPLLALADHDMPAVLKIGKVAGDHLLIEADIALPIGAREVAWCPKKHSGVVVLARQPEGGSSLCHFSYDPAAHRITLQPVAGHTGDITGLAWSGNGTRLAIAEYDPAAPGNQIKLTIYRYSDGELSVIDQRLLAGNSNSRIRCCSWQPDGSHLIVGRGSSPDQPRLMLYRVTDAHIVMTHQVSSPTFSPTTDIAAACFCPDAPNRFFIGLANGGGAFHLRSCLISDSERIVPEQQYEVAHNVYKIAISADRSLFAIDTFDAGWNEPGTGSLSLYPYRDGSIGDRCGIYPHAERGRWMKWAPHMTQLGVLDVANQCIRTTARHGMILQDVVLIGNSPIAWQTGLFISDAVLVDGQEYAWQTPAHSEWHLAPGSSLSLRNVVLQPTDSLMLCGASDALCLFEHVRLDDGELACYVPTRLSGQCSMQGRVSGQITFAPHTQINLHGDTQLAGTITIEGRVSLQANGHALNLEQASFHFAPGAQLAIYNARVQGFAQTITADDSYSALHLADSRVILTSATDYEHGTIACDNSWVTFAHESYYVANALFNAQTDESLWQVARLNGALPASSGGQSAVPSAVSATTGPIKITSDDLILDHDLRLTPQSPLHITGHTTIRGNGYAIHCARSNEPLITLAPGAHLVFTEVTVHDIQPTTVTGGVDCSIEWASNSSALIGSDGALTMPWYVSGSNVRIDGGMHEITLSEECPLRVRGRSAVHIDRLSILNVSGHRFVADGATTTVKLRNVLLELSDEWEVGSGAWHVMREVTIVGPHRMRYTSSRPLSIARGGMLSFERQSGLIYAPFDNSKNLLVLDKQGTLMLDNATLENRAAIMQIVDGIIACRGSVGFISHDGSELRLGDREDNALLSLNPEPGSSVHLFGAVSMFLNDSNEEVFAL